MKAFYGAATLAGSIIGAGLLGVPYVVSQVGFLQGGLLLLGIGLLCLLLNLFYGEVILRTKGKHQLPGYVKKYIGPKAGAISTLMLIFGIYGALTAYLLGEGTVLSGIFGGSPVFWGIVFFLIAGVLLYRGIKTIGHSELILTGGLVAIIILVAFLLLPTVQSANLQGTGGNVLGAYGVILFACLGFTSLPVVKEVMGKQKGLRKAILIGSIIPMVLYLLFTFVVVGDIGGQGFLSLPEDSRIASAAIQHVHGGFLGILINLFGFLSMGTSFLVLGVAMQEVYRYDMGMSKLGSFGLTLGIPLVIFFIDAFVVNITNFIAIIGITGAITGSVNGMLITVLFHKAKEAGDKKPAYKIAYHPSLCYLLCAVFLLGIVYSLMTFF